MRAAGLSCHCGVAKTAARKMARCHPAVLQQCSTPELTACWVLQQATRPARKMYVGDLPPGCSETELTHFFNQILPAAKGTSAGERTCLRISQLCACSSCLPFVVHSAEDMLSYCSKPQTADPSAGNPVLCYPAGMSYLRQDVCAA